MGIRKPRPTASRLRPVYLADFLPEKVWRTFYNEVLPDFLAYGFAHSINRHFNRILKGLSHEIDLKNFDQNLQNLA